MSMVQRAGELDLKRNNTTALYPVLLPHATLLVIHDLTPDWTQNTGDHRVGEQNNKEP